MEAENASADWVDSRRLFSRPSIFNWRNVRRKQSGFYPGLQPFPPAARRLLRSVFNPAGGRLRRGQRFVAVFRLANRLDFLGRKRVIVEFDFVHQTGKHPARGPGARPLVGLADPQVTMGVCSDLSGQLAVRNDHAVQIKRAGTTNLVVGEGDMLEHAAGQNIGFGTNRVVSVLLADGAAEDSIYIRPDSDLETQWKIVLPSNERMDAFDIRRINPGHNCETFACADVQRCTGWDSHRRTDAVKGKRATDLTVRKGDVPQFRIILSH